MELRDVRRFAVTLLLLAVIMLGWLLLLYLQAKGAVELGGTAAALEAMSLPAWLWLGAGTYGFLLLLLALTVFGVGILPEGWAKGSVRQVQCDNCKAVFFINDTGHRPLTHRCPNCRFLGIYDGLAEPVGEAHRTMGRRDVLNLALRCRNCSHRFEVTDTGVRPLQVHCPQCQAIGHVR